MMSRMNAERVMPDGWRLITEVVGSSVSLGDGIVTIITQKALDCDCGKGLDCSHLLHERMSHDISYL